MIRYFIILLFLFSGCQSHTLQSKKKVLFVSILPLKYFADQLIDGNFEVEVMVPPGASPETYSPTPKQMIHLSEAKAYFSIGYLGFEQVWLENFKATNANLQVYPTSAGIEMIKEEQTHTDHDHPAGVDPHIWSSPKTAQIMADNLYQGLIKIDPEHALAYEKNLKKLKIEINKVDSTIAKILKASAEKRFVVFHPALGYLARDYGLEQLAIEFEGKIPSPKHLKQVIEAARKAKVKFILIQKEFDAENAEVIAKETGSTILQIDPLDYNWSEQVIDIAQKISKK
ncbi:MAG: zinc ABC transporter substrate-binding protein [Bacteroidia bacterium]|nr:zinc ABC transporter substrate-binding protein [Bacteroidia bacterium]